MAGEKPDKIEEVDKSTDTNIIDTNFICDGCDGQDSKLLKRCPHCKVIYYCSEACQIKHWPKHKIECKDLAEKRKKMAFFPVEYGILAQYIAIYIDRTLGKEYKKMDIELGRSPSGRYMYFFIKQNLDSDNLREVDVNYYKIQNDQDEKSIKVELICKNTMFLDKLIINGDINTLKILDHVKEKLNGYTSNFVTSIDKALNISKAIPTKRIIILKLEFMQAPKE